MLHDLELYKEFYEGPERATAQWQLIFSDDPAEIKSLGAILKMSQAQAVEAEVTADVGGSVHILSRERSPLRSGLARFSPTGCRAGDLDLR